MDRNISGIYIHENGQPKCFEDCQEKTQKDFLDSLSEESLKSMCLTLANTLKNVCELFDIQTGE